MKVLYLCTELYPFLKTGGLGDVSAGLPPALQALGCEVRLLMPAFPALHQAAPVQQMVAPLPRTPTPWGSPPDLPSAHLVLAHLPGVAQPVYLLQAPVLFDRPGNPYLGPDGHDWRDNASRFAALSWAGALLGQGLDPQWTPDVLHGHDWHAGLMPAYVRAFADAQQPTPATVFTVHNLAYQGIFPAALFPQLGLPPAMLDVHGVEFFGQLSFMKAALRYADRLTTVSPTYAQEIQHPAQGMGLDGLLRERSGVLTGILNGVDEQVWNPATDALLPTPFDAQTLDNKAVVKRALQERLGLAERHNALVFGVVSRLTPQKGLHLLVPLLDELVQRGGQLALLGQGDEALEQALVDAALRHPGAVAVRMGYDEDTAHAVIAGADVLLMPSVFEPCGLTQLYGLRYGSLPLVHRVGGLADTVVDCTLENLDDDSATGFVFDAFTADALRHALGRAFALFRRPQAWRRVQQQAMAQRFDWATAAHHYLAVYRSATLSRPAQQPRLEEREPHVRRHRL
jgi:starch synthase